jgi:predicted HTH domain antitoxin
MLAAFGGNISRAAKAARKNRRAFWEIMKKHRIRAEDFLTEEPKAAHPDQRTAFPPG